jgi:hypothetical protein
MQAVAVILVLLSVGAIAAPMGAIVLMYRNDLPGLVITPQIRDLMSGNSSLISSDVNSNSNNDNINSGPFVTPTLVSANIDNVSRTFTITVNYTNTLAYDLTLNNFTADVQLSQDNYPLGSISLTNPVTLPAGQASLITVSGFWTQDAENHISTNYPGATSVDVNLVNITVNVNGIVIQQSQPISVGSIPLT